MGNEISSGISDEQYKKQLRNMSKKQRIDLKKKILKKYIDPIDEINNESKRLTYQPKSKTGNSKTSNKLVVSNKKKTQKSLEKKSRNSSGKKPTEYREINASKKFIIEFLEKKKIQYVKGYNKPYYEKLVIENRLIGKVEKEFKKKKNK